MLAYLAGSVVAPAPHATIDHENANMNSPRTDGGYSGQDISGGRFAPADGRTVAELRGQANTYRSNKLKMRKKVANGQQSMTSNPELRFIHRNSALSEILNEAAEDTSPLVFRPQQRTPPVAVRAHANPELVSIVRVVGGTTTREGDTEGVAEAVEVNDGEGSSAPVKVKAMGGAAFDVIVPSPSCEQHVQQ
jgi:hypothetical protein